MPSLTHLDVFCLTEPKIPERNPQPSPEEIFNYVYAVLYASTYREKYAEFLRMDFPRIPFTSDGELFLNPEAVWTYRIGGYQVCEKWPKDRLPNLSRMSPR